MTIPFDFLVGDQPMNNPKTDIGGLMYYMALDQSSPIDARVAEVRRLAVPNGMGGLSIRDVLINLPIQEKEESVHVWAKHVSVTSSFAYGRCFHVDGIGDFVACTGNDYAITKPIFRYTDRDGNHRYIASPAINNLMVRIKKIQLPSIFGA